MIIVCLGDLHIPDRKQSIPLAFSNTIIKLSPDLILSTGDHTEYHVLKSLEKFGHVEAVNGNMENLKIERIKVIKILDSLKILLLHGDQFGRGNLESLAEHAKKLNCNIVVSGHTHIFETKQINEILCVNPGTATGAGGLQDLEDKTFAVIELIPQNNDNTIIEITVKKILLDSTHKIIKSTIYKKIINTTTFINQIK